MIIATIFAVGALVALGTAIVFLKAARTVQPCPSCTRYVGAAALTCPYCAAYLPSWSVAEQKPAASVESAFPPEISEKLERGTPLSDREEWQILNATLPPEARD
jgi:hypothetical protein